MHGILIVSIFQVQNTYVSCQFVVGNVGFDAKGPFDMQLILIQLHQEYYKDKNGIAHKKEKYTSVSQFCKGFSDAGLENKMQTLNYMLSNFIEFRYVTNTSFCLSASMGFRYFSINSFQKANSVPDK